MLIIFYHYNSVTISATSNQPSSQHKSEETKMNITFAENSNTSQEKLINVTPEFTEVSDPNKLIFKNPNLVSLSALIAQSWTGTWVSLSKVDSSSLDLIYADYKLLENVKGVHWRLVFRLTSSENKNFIALDVAVLENGMVDIFRNVSTRILDDIRILYNVGINESKVFSLEFLKESFLHNSPMIMRSSSFVKEKGNSNTKEVNLNIILDDVGADTSDVGAMDMDTQIGSGLKTDLNNYD
jgi:hypothetical protein